MRLAPSAVNCGLLLRLVAPSLLLPACPPHDDYYIQRIDSGSAPAIGGTDAGGASTSISGGGNAAGAPTGSGGGDAAGSSGCVTATNQRETYAFCFSSLIQANARANCGELGMTLAVVNDEPEDAWITSTLSRLYAGESSYAFIGANDVTTEGEWRRADGVIFWRGGANGAAVDGNYANWEAGQPSDAGKASESEDCLTIGIAAGTWNDMSCDTALPYVCEPR